MIRILLRLPNFGGKVLTEATVCLVSVVRLVASFEHCGARAGFSVPRNDVLKLVQVVLHGQVELQALVHVKLLRHFFVEALNMYRFLSHCDL